MERRVLEFENPEKEANEEEITRAADELRRYLGRYREEDPWPQNQLIGGWSSNWLTQTVTQLITVLFDYQDRMMPEDLLVAVKFLTADRRIQEQVQAMGLLTGTVQQLLSIILHGSYKKVVGQFLKSFAETSKYCQKAAARALENDLGAMDGPIQEKHVILFKLAIGFQEHMTSMTVVNSFVAHVVSMAAIHQQNGSTEWAIRILKTMYERGDDIAFELLPPLAVACVGSTANPTTLINLFLNYDFLTSRDGECSWIASKTEALEFLALPKIDWTEIQPAAIVDSKEAIFDAFQICFRQNDKALQEVTCKIASRMFEMVDETVFAIETDGLAVNENQSWAYSLIKSIIREKHREYSPLDQELLNLCLAVNRPDLDGIMSKEWDRLNFSKVDGVSIRNALILAKVTRRDQYNDADFRGLNSSGLCHVNDCVPTKQRLTRKQILLLLEKCPILWNPENYLRSVDWNLFSLQNVLHLFSMLLREVTFGRIAKESWDHGEFCSKMGITLLRQIMNPGFLEDSRILFPGIPSFGDHNMDPRFKTIIDGMGAEFRSELNQAARKSLTSHDKVFKELLEQIVSLLELSLTLTDRAIITTNEFVLRARPCIKGLIGYFPMLACRLSVALTRAYLDPAQFGEHDFRDRSIWEKTRESVWWEMMTALPNPLELTTSRPRVRKNQNFLHQKKIVDAVYNDHRYDTIEFRDWLTVRAFAVGYLNDKGAYSAEY